MEKPNNNIWICTTEPLPEFGLVWFRGFLNKVSKFSNCSLVFVLTSACLQSTDLTKMLWLTEPLCACTLRNCATVCTASKSHGSSPWAGSLIPVRWCLVSNLIKLLDAIPGHNVWIMFVWQTCSLLRSCAHTACCSPVSTAGHSHFNF